MVDFVRKGDECKERKCHECEHRVKCIALRDKGADAEGVAAADFDLFAVVHSSKNVFSVYDKIKAWKDGISEELLLVYIATLMRATINPRLADKFREV